MKYEKGLFTTVPNILFLSGKDPVLQTIYLWMCFYSNKEGMCFPSQKTLSEVVGVSINSIKKYLAILELEGFISRERRYKDNYELSSIYKIMIRISTDDNGGVSNSDIGEYQNLTEGVSNSDIGGVSNSAYRTKSTSLTKSTELSTVKIDELVYKEYSDISVENRSATQFLIVCLFELNFDFKNETVESIRKDIERIAKLKSKSVEQIIDIIDNWFLYMKKEKRVVKDWQQSLKNQKALKS